MILIVHSEFDVAGANIGKCVLKEYLFKKTASKFKKNPSYSAEINGQRVVYISLKQESVDAQTLPENFPNSELILFLSKHCSQSGKPTLSVHAPGNFSSAELGGLPHELSIAPANSMKNAIRALNRLRIENNLDYEVSFEATHHGPSLHVPTMFMELGSSEKQWNDLVAAQVVAKAAIETINNFGSFKRSSAIGIGGTHYNQKFTKLAIDGDVAFGHMIPKYAISKISSETLLQCIERSSEPVKSVILDWKGIKREDKDRLLALLTQTGLPTTKI